VSLSQAFFALPEPLREGAYTELAKATPQRSTDIFYEDDERVFAIRQGIQFMLTPPASIVWKKMGTLTVAGLIEAVRDELKATNLDEIRMSVIDFLLNAGQYGLVVLFPQPASRENLTPKEKK
jgi:hypothetical protein